MFGDRLYISSHCSEDRCEVLYDIMTLSATDNTTLNQLISVQLAIKLLKELRNVSSSILFFSKFAFLGDLSAMIIFWITTEKLLNTMFWKTKISHKHII